MIPANHVGFQKFIGLQNNSSRMSKVRPKPTKYRRIDSEETFSSTVSFHLTRIIDKINALKVLSDWRSQTLDKQLDLMKAMHFFEVSKLKGKDKSAYDDYESYISQYATEEKKSKKIQRPTVIDAIRAMNIQSPKAVYMIHKETKMYNDRENIRRASKEMILVYLIIIFEEFLTNILISLFKQRPELLKSSQKSIKYEEAFQYDNLTELLGAISRREVESEINSDIDILGKYLSDKFGLKLNKRSDWKQFKEYFYRRNITVHNYGYPNATYIHKTGYKGPIDWLEIDNNYLEEAFRNFESYSNEIHSFFSGKFH